MREYEADGYSARDYVYKTRVCIFGTIYRFLHFVFLGNEKLELLVLEKVSTKV